MTAYREEIRTRLRDRAEQLQRAGSEEDASLLLAAEHHLEFTHQWYASRFERLNRMAREEFPKELCHRYFSVVANGTAEPHEPPTQAQIVNYERIRAELAEEKLRENTRFVLDFFLSGSGMCERHQEALRHMTPGEFIEQEKARGCSACAAGKLADILAHAKCAYCANRAACFGSYEGSEPGFACDNCCGHGCEDGHCEPVRTEGT